MAIVPTSRPSATERYFQDQRDREQGSPPPRSLDLSGISFEEEQNFRGAAAGFMRMREEEDRAALTMRAAVRGNPDKAARANQLSRFTGIPADTVERNLPEVEQRVAGDSYASIIKGNPSLNLWYSSPRQAAASSDDVPALADLSASLRGISEAGNVRRRQREIGSAHGLLSRGAALFESGMASMQAGGARLEASVARALGFEEWAQHNDAIAAAEERVGSTQLPGQQTWSDLKGQPTLGRLFNYVLEQGVQSAPGMITAYAGLPLYAATQAGNIGQQRARNNGRNIATLGDVMLATPAAVASAYLERLGVEAIFASGAKSALGRVAAAAAGEGATEFAQSGIEYAGGTAGTKAGLSFSEMLDQSLAGAVAGTGMGGGLRGSVEAGYKAATSKLAIGVAQSFRARLGDTIIGDWMARAEQSKLRKRDADAFERFVAMHTEGTAGEHVFVPAETVRALYQEEGRDWTDPDDDLLGPVAPDFREQMETGLATGGDVVMPTSAVAAHLAGTPTWERIKGDVRMAPGGISMSEAELFENALADEMDRLGKKAAEEARADFEADAPRSKVFDTIFSSIRQAGFSTNAARAYSEAIAERYQVRAERLGDGRDAYQLLQQSLAGLRQEYEGVQTYGRGDGLDVLVNAMRREAAPEAPKGPSLLERITDAGGIEDRGGDIASMGGKEYMRGGHFGRAKRYLIRDHDPAQGSFVGGGPGKTLTPDAWIDTLMSEGYFGERAERPDVNELLDMIGRELRGEPIHSEAAATRASERQAAVSDAADQLRRLLEEAGLDPNTATKAEIRRAVDARNAEEAGARSLYQAQRDATFYSALERAIEGAKLERGSAEQWEGTLKNAAGVKREELEWSGLLDWLDMRRTREETQRSLGEKPDLIERSAMLEVVRSGGIKVEEVVLGTGRQPTAEQVQAKAQEIFDQKVENLVDGMRRRHPDLDEDEAIEDAKREVSWDEDEARLQLREEDEHPTQFEDWSSDRENPTYRELLITLPVAEGGNPDRAASTHWDVEGVIAHARFMEKLDADGVPVLFIEEIQSDWHQKGRKEGYERGADPEEVERLGAVLKAARDVEWAARQAYDQYLADAPQPEADEAAINEQFILTEKNWRDARLKVREAEIAWNAVRSKQGIPSAPFRSSWPGLVMKRMIRWAVDHGYSRVAWTTGEQAADLYSLRHHVPNIIGEEHTLPGGTKAYTLNLGAGAQRVVNENFGGGPYSAEQVKEILGDDLGGRFIERAAGNDGREVELAAGELEIGGEGMRAFYDRNVVNITNDIIKRYGVRVGTVEIVDETALLKARKAEAQAVEWERLAAIDGDRGRDTAARAADHRRIANEMKAVTGSQQHGFDITPALAEAAAGGFPLFQGEARGKIDFLEDGRALITLFQNRNMSTVLHEFGHLWLEELRTDAAALSSGKVFADWETVKAWFKREGHVVEDDQPIPTEAHEMWARSMERYFLEGKAPSRALEGAFATFRSWLVRIYTVVKERLLSARLDPTRGNLDYGAAPIENDVRRVMDRLLATDQAIAYAIDDADNKLLFDTAAAAGMNPHEYSAYRGLIDDSRNEAFNALLYRTMEGIRRRRTVEWREERDRVRQDVADEWKGRPEIRALRMARGTGGDTARPLSREGVAEVYGSDVIAIMPVRTVKQDGMHPDAMAELVGFPDGRTLIDALIGIEKRRRELIAAGDKRKVIDEAIDVETENRMNERHPDMFDDGSIEEEALAVIHNEKAGQVLAAEVRQLARAVREAPTPLEAVRAWAERIVREGRIVDQASAAALQRHLRAEKSASQRAEAAYMAGDMETAFREKQRQMFAHALYRAASEAKAAVDLIGRRLDRLGRAKTLKGMDQDYLDQIHGLLENHDLRRRSEKDIKERESFDRWAKKMEEQGVEVFVPERLTLAGDKHFTRLTYEEIVALDDAVQSLAHLGREKKSMLLAQEERNFNDLVGEAQQVAGTLPFRRKSTDRNEKRSVLRGVDALLTKVEFLADQLDGQDPNGVFNRVLVQQATIAANHKERLTRSVIEPLALLYNNMSRAQRRRLAQRVAVPEFVNLDPETLEVRPTTFMRMELVAVALNVGNKSNLEKMLAGETNALPEGLRHEFAWTEEKVMAVLNRELSADDWKFVEAVWRQIDTLWPEIVRSEREITGIVPEKIEGRVVVTAHGSFQGGYYPAVYDPTRSQIAADNSEGDAAKLMGQMGRTISTPKGHTITRTDAALPIAFSVERVLFNHIGRVTTRIAYGRYVRDALKFINDPRIRKIVDEHAGLEYHRALKPWLQRQVNEAALDTSQLGAIDSILRSGRVNATMVGLGFRATTMLAQIAGWANSVAQIGPKWMALGMLETARNMGSIRGWVFEQSDEMAGRAQAFDRDVRTFYADLAVAKRGAVGRATDAAGVNKVRALAFWGIGMIDVYLVAMPTWVGGYHKGLAEGMSIDEARHYADKAVRESQGAGRAKDLSALQDSNEGYRVLTMFYSYFNVLYNKQRETIHAARGGDLRRAAMNVTWLMMVGPLASALLTGDWPDTEEDEDWFVWSLRKMFFGLFASLPVIRDVAGRTERKLAGKFAGETEAPLYRAFTEMERPVGDLSAVLQGDDPSDRWLRNAITPTGYFLGLPTGQAGNTAQYLYDVGQGNQNPEGVGDVLFGMAKGPQKDQE